MSMNSLRSLVLIGLPALGGCAELQFHDAPQAGAFTYYEPQPYLVVKKAADCSFTAEVLTLPGAKRSVGFKSGLGSAKLSVKTTNGIITEIGQETDTKIPETITALTGAAKLAMGGPNLAAPAKPVCETSVSLHAIITDGDGHLTVEKQPAFPQ